VQDTSFIRSAETEKALVQHPMACIYLFSDVILGIMMSSGTSTGSWNIFNRQNQKLAQLQKAQQPSISSCSADEFETCFVVCFEYCISCWEMGSPSPF